MWSKNSELHNFTNDNTISCTSETIEKFVETLQEESEEAIKWFKENKMIVNPRKLEAIIITILSNHF